MESDVLSFYQQPNYWPAIFFKDIIKVFRVLLNISIFS